MTKKAHDEEAAAEKHEDKEPESLVGSGAPQVQVKALVNTYGKQAGDTWTVAKTPEVELDIEAGYLEEVKA